GRTAPRQRAAIRGPAPWEAGPRAVTAGSGLRGDRVARQQRADPGVQALPAVHEPRAQLALQGEARLERHRARGLVAVERDPLDALQAQLGQAPPADRAHRLGRVALPARLGRGPVADLGHRAVLGLRPGDAVQAHHAQQLPAGRVVEAEDRVAALLRPARHGLLDEVAGVLV